MSDFDYGNARLRAMKSRLLARRELEAMVEGNSIPSLITALTRTAYRKPVEAALVRASGMDCIVEAVRIDLLSSLGTLGNFYQGGAREMAVIVLRAYDIHNLKAILRGLSKNVPPGEILTMLLPVGDLKYETLMELSRASGPRGVIDSLASMNLPIAQPFLRLRAEHPGAEVSDMELALDQWYFREATISLKNSFQTEGYLYAALKLDADLTNLLTVLRFAHAPVERKLVSYRLGAPDFNSLFVGPGRLPFALLGRAASQDTAAAAVEVLSGTPYEPALRAGLEAYTLSNRLSSFEKYLKKHRLDWMRGLIHRDPLGIGVLLGYLALKVNETSNIRWIAHGINLRLKPDAIRMELELIS